MMVVITPSNSKTWHLVAAGLETEIVSTPRTLAPVSVTHQNAHKMSDILYSRRQTLKQTLAGEGVELTRFSPSETIWTKYYGKDALKDVTVIQSAFLDASRPR